MPITRQNADGLIEVQHPDGGWIPTNSLVPPPDGLTTKLNNTQYSLLQAILGAIQAIVPPPPQPNLIFRTPYIETALTSAGVTATRTVSFCTNIVFQVIISGTSGTTVVRPEGSLDGANWFTLGDDAQDISYTANGTYAIASNLILTYARFRVVSMPSGASVAVVLLVGGANNS
jgi:hypothetical protein